MHGSMSTKLGVDIHICASVHPWNFHLPSSNYMVKLFLWKIFKNPEKNWKFRNIVWAILWFVEKIGFWQKKIFFRCQNFFPGLSRIFKNFNFFGQKCFSKKCLELSDSCKKLVFGKKNSRAKFLFPGQPNFQKFPLFVNTH